MKKIFLTISCLLLAACMFWRPASQANPDPNHTHADFAVYVLGTKLDFTDDRYMSEAPVPVSFIPTALAHDEEEGTAAKGREYLHLHDGNGDVIHRHKPALTLGDFFTSLGFVMEDECLTIDDYQLEKIPAGERDSYGLKKELCNNGKFRWQMFVNDKETLFDHHYVFQDLDRILLTYDAADIAPDFDALVTDEACLYSQTCPRRGDPPTENCIADPAVPCVIPQEDL